VNKIF
jgi:hypothetical protein